MYSFGFHVKETSIFLDGIATIEGSSMCCNVAGSKFDVFGNFTKGVFHGSTRLGFVGGCGILGIFDLR